jgi:hypothetical protein
VYHNFKQFGRNIFSFFAQRTDKIIVGFAAAVNSCCPEPACNGFSAFSKEHSCKYYIQPPPRALMQDTAKSNNHYLPEIRKNPFGQHWLSFPKMSFLSIRQIGRMSHFYLKYQLLKS